ncbi:MAG: YceI family protein [Thermoanaerobaculia bacterium]
MRPALSSCTRASREKEEDSDFFDVARFPKATFTSTSL